MSQWKFQIISNRPGFIAKGRLMDAACNAIEDEVNAALRYPFRFHKVNKIVLCLGEGPIKEPDYIEQLGVGLKQWREFDLDSYKEHDAAGKSEALRTIVRKTFDWLEGEFNDAQFVAVGRKNLKWAQAPSSKSLERARDK